jgi:phosphoglycerol transferase MdoB-like AlkP superfamily enzyme
MAVGVTDSGSLKKFASGDKSGYEGLMDILEAEGYEKIAEHQGKLEIYQRKQ